ncbi:MAG: WG repeat-containing protein, partial [Bacteroidales bacterium]
KNGYYGFVDTTGKEVIPTKYKSANNSNGGQVLVKLDDVWLCVDKNDRVLFSFDSGITDVKRLNNGLYGAYKEKNKKYGFLNQKGKTVIPFNYDSELSVYFYYDHNLDDFEGLIMVNKKGKYGYINETGKTIIPFDYYACGKFSEGKARIRMPNACWSYIDKTGKVILSTPYFDVEDFSDGMAMVKRGKSSGYIDATGKEVIPCIYESAEPFSNGYAKVTLKEVTYYIDKNGITPVNEAVGDFVNGVASVKRNGKWGLIDSLSNNLIVPEKYENIGEFSEDHVAVQLGGKWGFINRTGQEVTAIKYESTTPFNEGIASVQLDKKWGAIDKSGRELIPNLYDEIGPFSHGIAMVALEGKYGFIDRTGKRTVPLKYNDIKDDDKPSVPANLGGVIVDGMIEGGKWGLVDRLTGAELTPFIYDQLGAPVRFDVFNVMLQSKTGLMDNRGNLLTPVKYDRLSEFAPNGLAKVNIGGRIQDDGDFGYAYSGGKWGFINLKGEEIIPVIFDAVSDFESYDEIYTHTIVNITDTINYVEKYGVYNEHGKLIIPVKFFKITASDNGFVVAYEGKDDGNYNLKDAKYGVIDSLGRERVPPVYDEMFGINEGFCVGVGGEYEEGSGLVVGRKYGLINADGQELIPPTYLFNFVFNDGLAKVALMKEEKGSNVVKYGFVDIEGNVRIPCIYESASDFYLGEAQVAIDWKSNYTINTKGEKISQ